MRTYTLSHRAGFDGGDARRRRLPKIFPGGEVDCVGHAYPVWDDARGGEDVCVCVCVCVRARVFGEAGRRHIFFAAP